MVCFESLTFLILMKFRFFSFFSYVLLIFFIRNYCLIHGLGFAPKIYSKAFIVQFCYLLQVILHMIACKLGVLYYVYIHSDSPLLFVDYILFFSLVLGYETNICVYLLNTSELFLLTTFFKNIVFK